MAKGTRQVNGAKGGSKDMDTFDVDDPEFVRHLRRPVEVKQDVRQMEERKRVNLILKSKSFRHELENIVVEQLKSGGEKEQPSSDEALKEISNLLPPSSQNRIMKANSLLGGTAVKPIADFSKVDVSKYAKGEKLSRSKLAACCRLIDVFGWSQGDQSFVSAHVENGQYLVVGNGQLYSEVTAGGLIKVDDGGNVTDQGSTNLLVNQDMADLNIAVHESKNNIACVIYLNNPSIVSVSGMDCGLLPLSQDAMSLGEVQTVDWGAGGDSSSRDVARQAFKPQTKVVLLRNTGAVIGGESVEEAFHVARSLMNAVDTQLRTMPLGLDNICLPSEETRRKAFERANRAPSGEDGKRRWKRGELEFEALMRHLENSGLKTGYVFHAPLTRQVERTDRVNAEVEVPPASTSFAYGEEDLNNSMIARAKKEGKWLNSPNAYKREEIEEKGAPKPKKITKWVPETGPGSLIKIEDANQFAPVGTDPKELKAKYKAIRKDHFDENITAGPQSRILEGVTWEEAQKIKEGNVQSDTIIVVGAASRGIIQRDHVVSSNVYKTYYAPNPFDNVTEEDVEEYKAEIMRKTKGADSRGLTTDDDDEMIVPGPDGKLISSDERMQQVRHVQTEVSASPGRQTPEVLSDAERIQSPNSPKEYLSNSPVAANQPLSGNQPVTSREPAVTSPNKPGAVLQSPTRSTSSGEGLHGDRSGTEGGTETESATPASGGEKKKKKRGFRMPSFSSKKKEKQ